MKKIIILLIASLISIVMINCGSVNTCDAYRKSDYTKMKKDDIKRLNLRLEKR
jgi:uncharacterized protein YxeA